MKNGEILKIRAERFLETARDLQKKGYYDLCAFNIEQAVQLFLKYYLWQKLGDFPKTHEITKLLHQYGLVSGKEKEITELIKRYQRVITDLEVAYIESRYLPVSFFADQIEEMFIFLKELLSILQND